MKRWIFIAALLAVLPGAASAFNVTGRFLYEDRMWDKDGYTGTVQNLPVRHAKVEVVNLVGQVVLATGYTDVNGNYALAVTGQVLPVSFYVRCSTDGTGSGYQIRVVDNFQRIPTVGLNLVGSMIYSITTANELAHPVAQDFNAGTYLTQDTDGMGVAQAFNIFDCGVDFFDWLATPQVNGALPSAAQFIVYGWSFTSGNTGSNYSQQGIYIGSDISASDTDGWSDTVILHETGHWFDDLFSRTNNPGGAHFIGDNNANVLLAYGEGAATFHCGKARELRAPRLNLVGQPVDNHVSVYSDLVLPPPVGTPGGLSFAYDFETGNFNDGSPIGQRGSANETNVTSALWDLVDGTGTPDESPGVDDDAVEVSDAIAYNIEHNYLRPLSTSNPITVEDYYQGWFSQNGANFMKPGMDGVFVTLAQMPFFPDSYEADGTLNASKALTPVEQQLTAGHMVISELELGAQDAVEVLNAGSTPVDLTGWTLQVYVNDDTQPLVNRIYVFPPITVAAGDVVAVHERGDITLNGQYHLYAGDNQAAWNASWNPGLDGACVLRKPDTTAVDFVKWKDANNVDNIAPVPPGTAFTGSLASPPGGHTLARDVSGTDTDAASDWTSQLPTLGSANHGSPQHHTIYGIGDSDIAYFQAEAGKRYGFEARAGYSASDTRIELLSPQGAVLASNDNSDPSVRDSRLDFLAVSGGIYYVRTTHVGPNTDWAEYDLVGYVRPPSTALVGPPNVNATAYGQSDVSDGMDLQWLNGSVYDSVHVSRDGMRIASLAGTATHYVDHVPRGLHRYDVSGKKASTETAQAHDTEFAGIVHCHSEDNFESGNSSLWVTDTLGWGVTPFAQSGTWAFTDSPAGLYKGCPAGASGCHNEATATFGVPAVLAPGSTFEWDQICVTEATFDFCIVEISADGGASWTELARYDANSDAGWADMVADPTDWRHASLSLAAYVGQRVKIRFRLESDSNLEFDGWYVDNVQLGSTGCTDIAAVETPLQPLRLAFSAPVPNPTSGAAKFAFALPARQAQVEIGIYDASGRQVRVERLGAREPGRYEWTWNGRDASGRQAASGVYFARMRLDRETLTQKVLRLAR